LTQYPRKEIRFTIGSVPCAVTEVWIKVIHDFHPNIAKAVHITPCFTGRRISVFSTLKHSDRNGHDFLLQIIPAYAAIIDRRKTNRCTEEPRRTPDHMVHGRTAFRQTFYINSVLIDVVSLYHEAYEFDHVVCDGRKTASPS